MQKALWMALSVLVLGLVGCSGPRPFEDVDLSGNLTSDDLARYQRESKEVHARGEHGATAVLESSNGWLPGLLLYWRKGSVTRSGAADGPTYHVASTEGFGPLSVLYVSQTHATFDAKGQRVGSMTMGSVGWGHLAMWHVSDDVLANGERQQASSIHLAHHLINLHLMGGHTAFSLLSAPNVIGVEGHGGHGCH